MINPKQLEDQAQLQELVSEILKKGFNSQERPHAYQKISPG
jgi:hypothetical protein